MKNFDIELLAEKVHNAYLETCKRLNWPVKTSNQIPYSELSEDSKELDRASVKAVISNMHISKTGSNEGLDFGTAVNLLKSGCKVARVGWNGKGMFIYMQEGSDIHPSCLRGNAKKVADSEPAMRNISDTIKINGHIDMKAADGSLVIGWLASQTDMLSEDWVIVD